MGKKRKRGAEGDEDSHDDDQKNPSKDPVLSGQTSRFKKTLSPGIKSLHGALKLARGFERQKLGRRQKSATDNPHQLLRLREEVIVLKQLDLERTAKQYLVKQLVKSTRTKSHPVVVNLYGVDPRLEQPKSTAEGNVLGRLFNSAPVKQVLPGILNLLFDVLGVSGPDGKSTNKKGNSGTKSDHEPGPESVSGSAQVEQTLSTSSDDVNDSNQSFDGFSDQTSIDHDNDDHEEPAENENSKYISDDEMDRLLNEHQDRLASSDDEDEDEEEDDDDENDLDLSTSHTNNKNINRGGDERSTRDDVSVSVSPSPEPPSQRKKTKSSATTTTTSFLPSLSLGGYYSGSESGDDDDDDDDHHNSGPPLAKPRNNRRGQRARQKIAEKKFGKNAKHLAGKENKRGESRNSGWDPQRGAVDGDHQRGGRDRFRHGGQSHGHDRRGHQMTEQKDTTRGSSKKEVARSKKRGDDQGPLHPSWEAARRKKTQSEQNQAIFAGKKITFD